MSFPNKDCKHNTKRILSRFGKVRNLSDGSPTTKKSISTRMQVENWEVSENIGLLVYNEKLLREMHDHVNIQFTLEKHSEPDIEKKP